MAGRSVAPSKENMHLQALQPKNRGPGPCVSVGFRSHFTSLLFSSLHPSLVAPVLMEITPDILSITVANMIPIIRLYLSTSIRIS